MGKFDLSLFYWAPPINKSNFKARSIPVLNPFNKYGRVFFFSWLGFLVAFLSWYTFPPLMTITIKKDLHMSPAQVANSNIVALVATLLVRLICGPLCDLFGPRIVFVGILFAGSLPTAMAGLVTTPNGLIALRFFVGVLGASFVPCQVWCTAFFDSTVVGTANALAAGWGNAGGGITYFLMPAVFDSLVARSGLVPHTAWRVAFIVPFLITTTVALGMLLTCDDTPTGPWSERLQSFETTVERMADGQNIEEAAVLSDSTREKSPAPTGVRLKDEEHQDDLAKGEIIVTPNFQEITRVCFSKETLALAVPYACSFGAELAFNSVVGAYYYHNFPSLGQTKSGNWAAMFGLLNVLFRPLGGAVADAIYGCTDSIWAKKLWLFFLIFVMCAFELTIGFTNPRRHAMFGIVAGFAFFTEAANGANFAVVPHLHPRSNGIVSGIIGAFGNLGGIIFAIIFRYNGLRYDRAIWIIGCVSVAANVLVAWIPPVPQRERFGRGSCAGGNGL